MAIVQLFRKEKETGVLFEALSAEYRKKAHQAILYDVCLYALVEATGAIVVAGMIWYGGGRILEGTLTFGVLVAFLGYIHKFFSPLMDLSSKYTIMQSAMAALERIFSLLDEETDHALAGASGREPASGVAAVPFSGDGRDGLHGGKGPAIAFEEVDFSYDGQQEVLRGVSFRAEAGETIALVGATGAGKSSCLKLLCRLYDPQGGRITIDGVDIRETPARDLRRRIGMVMQDVFLFSGDIYRNIRLGDELIDEDLTTGAGFRAHCCFLSPRSFARPVQFLIGRQVMRWDRRREGAPVHTPIVQDGHPMAIRSRDFQPFSTSGSPAATNTTDTSPTLARRNSISAMLRVPVIM